MELRGETVLSYGDKIMTQVPNLGRELKRRIRNRSAKVGIIGMGYVGLPLAVEMAREGFHVTGIDLIKEKVNSIK